MIELQSTTKLYGAVIGVNDITLSLEPGAYGLLGPNGSGKTTLLNMLTGQLRPTLGTVEVFGLNPWKYRDDVLRRIGYCPARGVLHPEVSAYDWVRYLVELHGFSHSEAGDRAEQSLGQVGLAGSMHREMGGYSRGMQQRVKLAQALAHDPEFLILDEPFSGLDPIGRHKMTEILHNWTRDGRSLLFASHILHEVEAVSPSFMLICNGRLLASGSAEEVQTLLADVPSQIRIRCDGANLLAKRLAGEEGVEALRVREGELEVSTRSPSTIYDELPTWVEESGVRIAELESSNDSLQTLFDSLLRIHRGES